MNMLSFGFADVMAELVRADERVRKAYQRSARREAERIMTESKRQVPVLTGNLKNSAFIRAENTADGCEVSMGYRADYAAAVHDIPAPPDRSPGGRSANHPHGKWKYLEDPMNQAVPGLNERIAEGTARGLRGQGGFGSVTAE